MDLRCKYCEGFMRSRNLREPWYQVYGSLVRIFTHLQVPMILSIVPEKWALNGHCRETERLNKARFMQVAAWHMSLTLSPAVSPLLEGCAPHIHFVSLVILCQRADGTDDSLFWARGVWDQCVIEQTTTTRNEKMPLVAVYRCCAVLAIRHNH